MVATVVWLLSLTGSAVAASGRGGERVGENLGHMLGGWAKSLYAGIAGIVAVMFLFNRRFAELAVFFGAAVVVGGVGVGPGAGGEEGGGIWVEFAGGWVGLGGGLGVPSSPR